MFKRLRNIETTLNYLDKRIKQLDYSWIDARRDIHLMQTKVDGWSGIKYDLAKVDTLAAMISELARRLDLANVAQLPDECVCESCGCKK